MKRILVLIGFFLIVGFSLKPVVVKTNQPLLLPSVKVKDTQMVTVLENHPTEYPDANTSFEKIYFSKDKFSDKNGFRPYPWGQEIFGGTPEFLCDNSVARTGEWSFQIVGNSVDDSGALAVPDEELKPIVTPGKIYYLSFWINYDIDSGYGVRLIQQFFREGDENYPSYASLGPWIKGSSNDKWVQIGLLVQAPEDATYGDPVITLWGIGKVNVDDAFFGEVKLH